ncbi:MULTISPECIES: BolA family transcriptional regulator [unclassified Pseudomonas]|uniref:BolA family protein n=1 Tax=unclassified Pseudomonas TaxID=196821 RepID=UPI00244CC542|nr:MULTISPECIES: BolA family transcriptional regulator [unclassified Pseudomonas]MDG9928845.1 BolA family transcriptional regulator [Pseudomonas sp. GD04042]MDH0484339.1 BolA family transcriptional regulator [Pseudomonas sp. GD04015]MDH0604171.1 BolA family transcriptional regulator [Pseudomonas sp. GD03869]
MSMRDAIHQALAGLQPEHLDVLDESHMHSRGQETHYKAVIVSEAFAGLNSVKRHQKVYATLGELMGRFHALALHTYTPEEWAQQGMAPDSPTCRGGSKHDH